MTVSVRTSWTVTSGCIVSLPQTVSCLSQCSLDSVTSPESCVLLTRGDSQDRGELSLQTSPGQVSFVSCQLSTVSVQYKLEMSVIRMDHIHVFRRNIPHA